MAKKIDRNGVKSYKNREVTMKKSIAVAIFITLITALVSGIAGACTAFTVTAADGTRICTRTMEFGVDLHPGIVVVPRALAYASPALNGTNGVKWQNKYGFVGIDAFGDYRMVMDGMNEKGLSFSALWYEPDTRYQTVSTRERKKALSYELIGDWILGNFGSIREVVMALHKVRVYGVALPQMNNAVLPLHFIISDAAGGCIVVEYDNGVLHIYDNKPGIMTNAPNFPWQLNNLRLYAGMTNTTQGRIDFAGLHQDTIGHGTGFTGLPGDYTPPSRFVRIAILTHFARQAKNAAEALNLSRHIIDNVDIVDGTIVDKNAQGKIIAGETTQWTVFKDLTDRVLYFYTYENPSLHMVDLKRLKFTGTKPLNIDMTGGRVIITDLTGQAR